MIGESRDSILDYQATETEQSSWICRVTRKR